MSFVRVCLYCRQRISLLVSNKLHHDIKNLGATFHSQMGCIVLLKVMICTSLGGTMYFLRYSVVALMFEWTPCLWCCAGQPNLHSPSNIRSVKYYFFFYFLVFFHTSLIIFVDPHPPWNSCYQVWELVVIEARLVWHFNFFWLFSQTLFLFLFCSNTAIVKHVWPHLLSIHTLLEILVLVLRRQKSENSVMIWVVRL